MNELRLILLIAGVALVTGIYFWGRRTRSGVSERPPATIQPTIDRPASPAVPQLDEAVAVRSRSVDAPIPVHAIDDVADDLPAISIESRSREPVVSEFLVTSAIPARLAESPPERIASSDAAEQVPLERASIYTAPAPKKMPSRRKIIALRLSAGETRVDGAKLKTWFEEAGLRHGKYGIFHRMYDESTPVFSVASMVEPGTFDPYAMSGMQFPGVTLFSQLPGPMDGVEIVSQLIACARDLESKMGGILQDERGLPLTDARAQRLRDEAADFLHLLGQA
jgi:cell division protein ZipA